MRDQIVRGLAYPGAALFSVFSGAGGQASGLPPYLIAAAAMDQRGSLKKAIAKESGKDVSDAQMEEFKSLVTEVLTQHASAILLDPEWGIPASKRRAKGAGLLMAYEKTGYDKTGPGRLPDLLDHWSVRRLKEAGADCIKILLYYTPFDPKPVNEFKHAWVERIGDECRANDIPFFLEFVGYEESADEKGLEYAKKKPAIRQALLRLRYLDKFGEEARARRANSFNYYRQIVGTDADPVKVTNTPGTQLTIDALPVGATGPKPLSVR